jgi:hypothetical protein
MNDHWCTQHGHECYIVPNNLYLPHAKLGDHIKIPRELLAEWAVECVSDFSESNNKLLIKD